jgi:hypothetical protein
MLKLEKARSFAQTPATSIKSIKLNTGDKIQVLELMKGEVVDNPEVFNDQLLCEGPAGLIKLPLREYFKMSIQNAKSYSTEGVGDGEIAIHQNFEIVSSEDRLDRDGEIVWPSQAYVGFAEIQAKERKYDYEWLKGTGVKESYTGPAVQNYTVKAL